MGRHSDIISTLKPHLFSFSFSYSPTEMLPKGAHKTFCHPFSTISTPPTILMTLMCCDSLRAWNKWCWKIYFQVVPCWQHSWLAAKEDERRGAAEGPPTERHSHWAHILHSLPISVHYDNILTCRVLLHSSSPHSFLAGCGVEQMLVLMQPEISNKRAR